MWVLADIIAIPFGLFMAVVTGLAFVVRVDWGLYVLLVDSVIWAAIVMAARGTIHGEDLKKKVRAAKAKKKEYHRFSRTIMLIAFGPVAVALGLLAVWLVTTLR